MKKKNRCLRTRFSTILGSTLAILLCAAPVLCADETVSLGQTKDIDYPVTGILFIYGTANLLTGASVTESIYVQDGGTLNMYSGSIGWFVNIATNNVDVTVYGTNFGGDGDFSVPGQVSFSSGSGTLTGNYGDGSAINLLFLSDIPIYLETPGTNVEQVEIDIKPGSYPNTINPGSNGLVPVAILSSEDFDATTVDPTTVELAGATVAVRGKANKSMTHEEDVNGDGLTDLVVQVENQSFNDLGAGGTVELTGTTFGGEDIVGYDEVVIVPPDK